MLRVVIMMIMGIVVGRLSGTPFGVRESFCVLLCLMLLAAALRRWDEPATAALVAVSLAFGYFLITNSDHNGQTATLPLPGVDKIEETMSDVREHLADTYRQQGLTDDQYAVVAAMTLGDKSAVTHKLKETYSKSGASHVFAVSGLHLGILWGLLALLLPVKAFPRASALLMTVLIWLYAFLVGLHASVVRATVMLTCYTVCKISARETDSVSVLTFTAFVLLTYNPQWLFDVGFQMSFLATLSILMGAGRFQVSGFRFQRVSKGFRWLFKAVWGIAVISILAQLAVAPLIAYYFGRFSTYFLLTNFIVSPGALAIIVLSVVVTLLSLLSGWMSIFCYPLAVCSWCLIHTVKLVDVLLEWVVSLPGSTIEGIELSAAQVAVIYVLIVCGVLLFVVALSSATKFGENHCGVKWS